MRQFKGESHQLSNKMMMLMSMEICMGVEKGGVRLWGIERGGRDLSHIRYLHNYLFKRPPTGSRKLVQKKKKKLKMVCFAASTLGLTSPKKVNFASFGYSLVFAVDRGCLELFLL